MTTMLFGANRVKMTVASAPGTGPIVLGAAVPDPLNGDYRSFAAAGVPDQAQVSYLMTDGHAYEFGAGFYTSATGVLARTVIDGSSNGGATINASASAVVSITNRSEMAHLNVYGPLTLYVDSVGGNDANWGFTPATAMRTLSALYQRIYTSYDLNGNVVKFKLAHGTYDDLNIQSGWVGGGSIQIEGDLALPDSVVIHGAAAHDGSDGSAVCVGGLGLPGSILLSGVRLESAVASGIHHSGAGTIYIGDTVKFGPAVYAHMVADAPGALIRFITSAYRMTRGASLHMNATNNGVIANNGALACTLDTEVPFANIVGEWINVTLGGRVSMPGYTFSGSLMIGCVQAVVYPGTSVDTGTTGGVGPGPNGYFPGSVNPVVVTGGYYT